MREFIANLPRLTEVTVEYQGKIHQAITSRRQDVYGVRLLEGKQIVSTFIPSYDLTEVRKD